MLRRGWRRYRDHSLLAAVASFDAIVLATLHAPVGSEPVLAALAVLAALLLAAVLCHLMNGWKLIAIVVLQGLVAGAIGLAARRVGLGDQNELRLLELTMPLGLLLAWNDDRYARQPVHPGGGAGGYRRAQ